MSVLHGSRRSASRALASTEDACLSGRKQASVSETRVAELEEQLQEARRELAETQTRMGGLASPHALAKTKGRVRSSTPHGCIVAAKAFITSASLTHMYNDVWRCR